MVMSEWGRTGVIGSTGFVGGFVCRSIPDAVGYHSRNISEIDGKTFDTLICAGAPATMWSANDNPSADRGNLEKLVSALSRAKIGRLVLISTIAVLSDAGAGYTETTAEHETRKAYGANRHALERSAHELFDAHVLRLPALFGRGLKKNFIFDLLNPVPSFVRRDKMRELLARFSPDAAAIADRFFSLDEALGMHRLDRQSLNDSGTASRLEDAFARAGFQAADFTNSESQFQYYNLENLVADIDICLDRRLKLVHICSEPWHAGELHNELIGRPFDNPGPPIVRENFQTEHAAEFGRSGPYLYSRHDVLSDLKSFIAARELA